MLSYYLQGFLYTVGNAGDGTGYRHCFQKSFLILTGSFPRKLYFYVECFAIGDAMSPDVRLALMPDVHQCAVLGIELADSVVSRHAAILAEGNDDFVLQGRFWVQCDHSTSYRNIQRRSPGVVALVAIFFPQAFRPLSLLLQHHHLGVCEDL